MFGNSEFVDLHKLYSLVREKGSYEGVSENGSWGLVAEELGFGSCFGSALKMIYTKYLSKLGLWSQMISNEKDLIDALQDIMKVDTEKFSETVSNFPCPEKENGQHTNPKIDKGSLDATNANTICENSSDLVNEGFSKRRKREGYEEMLRWIVNVAQDPCDPELGLLPERSKWKSYGEDQPWKQVLISRKALILKRNGQFFAEQLPATFWKRPMHPSMYEDSERIRASRRVIPASRSDLNEDFGRKNNFFPANSVFLFLSNPEYWKHVSIGPKFQTHVPEYTKETYENDSKWLGSRVWPLENGQKIKHLVERERMGKGRQDSCGCQYQSSIECVRFHITEKKARIMLELGSSFYNWRFDKMGEEVALSWTKTDEEKFRGVIRSNPPSLGKCFWDEIFKTFPSKNREELVSYYYNVFLLHRRIYQNRSTPTNIDSDDDEESELGSFTDSFRHEMGKSSTSIFYSLKKAHF